MILAVILALILILVLILVLPVGIGLKYENGVFFIIKAAFLSFEIPFEKKISKPSNKAKKRVKKGESKDERKPKKSPEREIDGIDFILDLFGTSRKFVRKHVSLTNFDLSVALGTGNAASTAISVGAVWGITYNMLALIDKLFWVKQPKVDVKPDYNKASFEIRAQGIIEARIVHIIAIAIIFVYKYFKYKNQKNKEEK